MRTIQCRVCRKQRKVSDASPSDTRCMRCTLFQNKVLLHKCFKGIVEQPDMKEFHEDMEKWYV